MIAEAVEAVVAALTPAPPPRRSDAEEFERISAEIEQLRAERGKVEVGGSPEDHAYGAKLAKLQAELKPIADRIGMASRHRVVEPEPEDARATKARQDSTDAERDHADAREAISAQHARRDRLEREGASEGECMKADEAIRLAESNERKARHRANAARDRVGVVVSLVQKERQDAARQGVAVAAAPLLAAAKAFIDAREGYVQARERAAHAGVQAPAAPSGLTRERMIEFSQALAGLL